MRKLQILLPLLSSVLCVSCGGPGSPGSQTSGIAYRALISNSVSAGTLSAGLVILDAQNDIRSTKAPISAGNNPGMMWVTPNKAQTLAFSSNGESDSDNQLSFINNASEQNSAHITLPGQTQSIVISPDSSTAYAAVPTAQVLGESPGVVEVLPLGSSSGVFNGQANVPAVQYLAINNDGSKLLGFSQDSDSVAIITPALIQTGNPVTFVSGFSRPVAAFFSSDDSTAYIVNCGPECGGNVASIQPLDMNSQTAGTAVSVPAATVALVQGSTVYLAGTPYTNGVPSQPCTGETTAASTCGVVTIFDLNTMSVVNPTPIIVTDGYHTVLQIGPNGQLYVGASGCTEIVPPVPPPAGAETRGCLAIYNSLTTQVGNVAAGGVLIPPENGDVTAATPIATRPVVYVVQGGSMLIYNDLDDALYYNPRNPNNPGEISNLVGQFVDVVLIDF